jgi:hypothetical protein
MPRVKGDIDDHDAFAPEFLDQARQISSAAQHEGQGTSGRWMMHQYSYASPPHTNGTEARSCFIKLGNDIVNHFLHQDLKIGSH